MSVSDMSSRSGSRSTASTSAMADLLDRLNDGLDTVHASALQHSAVETRQPPPDLQHPAVETEGANPAPDLQHLAVETELVPQPFAGPAEATRWDPNANGLAGDAVSLHGSTLPGTPACNRIFPDFSTFQVLLVYLTALRGFALDELPFWGAFFRLPFVVFSQLLLLTTFVCFIVCDYCRSL